MKKEFFSEQQCSYREEKTSICIPMPGSGAGDTEKELACNAVAETFKSPVRDSLKDIRTKYSRRILKSAGVLRGLVPDIDLYPDSLSKTSMKEFLPPALNCIQTVFYGFPAFKEIVKTIGGSLQYLGYEFSGTRAAVTIPVKNTGGSLL